MPRIFRRQRHDGPGVTGIEFTLIAVLVVFLSISTMTVVSNKYAHALGTGAAVLTYPQYFCGRGLAGFRTSGPEPSCHQYWKRPDASGRS